MAPVDRALLLETVRELVPLEDDDARFDPLFLPETYPAYKRLIASETHIWVGPATPFNMDSNRWEVFTFDGEWFASVLIDGQADA